MSRPTIRDVATAAGVSVTTVSHALNDKGRLDNRTRERIKDIAADLGYSANPRARALRTGSGKTIGLVTALEADQSPDRDSRFDWYMRTAFAGATEALRQGYALVLMPPSDQRTWISEVSVDGVLLIDPDPEGDLLTTLHARAIPVVVIGGVADGSAVASVSLDRSSAVSLVFDHFTRNKRGRPALLVDDSRRQMMVGTLDAYRALCADIGVTPIVEVIDTSAGRTPSAADATRRLLAAHPGVDGIYAPLDSIAIGCVSAIADAGADVEVVTAEGMVARLSGLTGVDTRREEQAAAAAQMLIELIETGAVPGSRVFEASIVER